MNKFEIATLVVTGLSLVLVVVSAVTEYWVEDGLFLGTFHHSGLLRGCANTVLGTICEYIGYPSDLPAWVNGVRAAMCLAFICNLVALVILLIRRCSSNASSKPLWIVAMVSLGLSVFWNLIAVVVFGVLQKEDLSWSWGLAIAAAFLEIVAADLLFLAKRSEDKNNIM